MHCCYMLVRPGTHIIIYYMHLMYYKHLLACIMMISYYRYNVVCSRNMLSHLIMLNTGGSFPTAEEDGNYNNICFVNY